MNALLKTLQPDLKGNIETTAIMVVDELQYLLDRLGISIHDETSQKIIENIINEVHSHINNV